VSIILQLPIPAAPTVIRSPWMFPESLRHKCEGPRVVSPVALEVLIATGSSPPVASDVALRRGCSGQGRQRQQGQAQQQHPRRHLKHEAEYTHSP